jgi:hypothetical protein
MLDAQFIIAILLLVSGTVMFAAGGLVLYRTASFLNDAVETTAIVYSDTSGNKSFHYTTQDDKKIVLPALVGTTSYEAGAQVRVLYDPAAPENARIQRERNWWLLPAITAVIGLVLLVAGMTSLARAVAASAS